jgi:hypothetical protein
MEVLATWVQAATAHGLGEDVSATNTMTFREIKPPAYIPRLTRAAAIQAFERVAKEHEEKRKRQEYTWFRIQSKSL